MTRAFPMTASDFEQVILSVCRQEGIEVVNHDGAYFARLSVSDKDGRETLGEINLSRVAHELAGKLS
jgi:hypothetical protein